MANFIFPIVENKWLINKRNYSLYSLHCKESDLSDYYNGNLTDRNFNDIKIFVPTDFNEILINKYGFDFPK